MKAAVRIATYAGVFVLGGALGAYGGFELARAQSVATDLADVAFYSTYVQTQRLEGNDDAYEDALRAYLEYLDSRRDSDSQLLSKRAYDFDSTLTHTRLSLLASKRGADLAAKEHLDRAKGFCAKAGWRDCSAENLVAVARRLDKGNPFAPGAKE